MMGIAKRAGLTVAMAAGMLACTFGAVSALRDGPGRHGIDAGAALARGDVDEALSAARAEVARDPGDASAQQRLAYAATLANGAPTREALAALAAAYAAAPFASADEMVWRVDFADAYWATMPDPLAERALSQIDALGRMGDDWRPRVRWCRSAVTQALAAAACATVPGVEQGADLPDDAASAAQTAGP